MKIQLTTLTFIGQLLAVILWGSDFVVITPVITNYVLLQKAPGSEPAE